MTGEMLIGVITLLLITTMLAAWKLTDDIVDKTTAFVLAIAIGIIGGTIGCRLIADYFGKGLDSNNPPVLYEHSTDGGGGDGGVL
jgi:hypothetical protein